MSSTMKYIAPAATEELKIHPANSCGGSQEGQEGPAAAP
jgi:hypothetical protein